AAARLRRGDREAGVFDAMRPRESGDVEIVTRDGPALGFARQRPVVCLAANLPGGEEPVARIGAQNEQRQQDQREYSPHRVDSSRLADAVSIRSSSSIINASR